jgi:23S rRNA (guanosine2251-2'-O)-methyltransferase
MARQEQFIFGIHAIQEALDSGKDIDRVLLRRGSGSDLLKQLTAELRKREIPLQQVPVERLNRITRKNHQGVIAWISQLPYTDITTLLPTLFEQGEEPFILVLDGVSDVRNFGAIARSAECAGVHAIVIPVRGSAAVNADAIKTSAGALHRIPVCRVKELAATVRFLKESGLKVIVATEKAEKLIYRADVTGPLSVVMGAEDRGVSGALLKEADELAAIPMKGEISSLNVSVAAGVMLFEVVRQRLTTAAVPYSRGN